MNYILTFMLINRIIIFTIVICVMLFDYIKGDSYSLKEIFYVLIAYLLFSDLISINAVSYSISEFFGKIEEKSDHLIIIISNKLDKLIKK